MTSSGGPIIGVQSDAVAAIKFGGVWVPIGSGRTVLLGRAVADVSQGDEGSFFVDKHGICGREQFIGNSVTAMAYTEDIEENELVTLHWVESMATGATTFAERGWVAVPIGSSLEADLGCGLMLNDDEEIVLDYDALLGCGLIEGDGDCDIQVDNTALAGTNLEAGTGCTLNLAQSIVDRIEDLEDAVTLINSTLTTIISTLVDIDIRIDALELCCYENTQAIEACCNSRERQQLVYNVTCVDGALEVEDACFYVTPCP
jgi:hypothetical protein